MDQAQHCQHMYYTCTCIVVDITCSVTYLLLCFKSVCIHTIGVIEHHEVLQRFAATGEHHHTILNNIHIHIHIAMCTNIQYIPSGKLEYLCSTGSW